MLLSFVSVKFQQRDYSFTSLEQSRVSATKKDDNNKTKICFFIYFLCKEGGGRERQREFIFGVARKERDET